MAPELHHLLPGSELQPFGDGQCGEQTVPGESQPRSGKPCEGRFRIPSNAQPGVTQFVWNWMFDRNPGGSGEEYFTVFDIEILEESTSCRVGSTTTTTSVSQDPLSVSPASDSSTPSPSPSVSGTCMAVSQGDQAFGLSAVFDSRCLSDAPSVVGCRPDDTGCRFCRVAGHATNVQNQDYALC